METHLVTLTILNLILFVLLILSFGAEPLSSAEVQVLTSLQDLLAALFTAGIIILVILTTIETALLARLSFLGGLFTFRLLGRGLLLLDFLFLLGLAVFERV